MTKMPPKMPCSVLPPLFGVDGRLNAAYGLQRAAVGRIFNHQNPDFGLKGSVLEVNL